MTSTCHSHLANVSIGSIHLAFLARKVTMVVAMQVILEWPKVS